LKNEFTRLKRKIFLRVLLIVLIALIVGIFMQYLLIDGILQAPFADGFISVCKHVLHFDDDSAHSVYQHMVRSQKSFWLSFGFFVLLLVVFYQAMSQFAHYFDEISAGCDKLTEKTDTNISLCPELDFMETKLNAVKSTLEKRKKDADESEQRKNDLVVYLAHDIKTPLTSVIGYLNLLDEAPDLPTEQRAKYVKITLEKANRLEQLIDEFFDITKFNLQTIRLEKRSINLSYMLMQMADEFYPILTPQGKKAIVTADHSLTVYADPDKLARVFNNILKNAISYSYPNSTIEITATAEEDTAIVLFKNTGETIPPHRLDDIFEKFYRLDSSRSANTGGSGLGLAIAKEIVTLHNGSITAESQDEITTFKVVLPLES